MPHKKLNEVREPQQLRSIQRTDSILAAAEAIILEKGYAKLTITEIAERAQITASSMYQYYHNKSEIILALARRYSCVFHEMFHDVYRDRPQNLKDHAQRLLVVLDNYFEIHTKNPVIRDLWMGAATDKEMQNLTKEEAARNLAFHVELAAPFFPEACHDEMRRRLQLLMQFGVSSVLLALEFPDEEGRRLIESAKAMVTSSWWDFVQSHQEAHLSPELI